MKVTDDGTTNEIEKYRGAWAEMQAEVERLRAENERLPENLTLAVRAALVEPEQLRQAAEMPKSMVMTDIALREAADEIERLRARENDYCIGCARREAQDAEIERLRTTVATQERFLRDADAEVKRLENQLGYINSTAWGVGPGPGWPT